MTTGFSRAAVAVGSVKTELMDFPLPEIPTDAGLLRIAVTGICGSDWGMYKNDKPGPRILGHEMVGTIEKIGPAASYRWGVKEGDLVALEEYLPCGHCEYCRSGEIRSCLETDQRLPGKVRFGSTPISIQPSLWGGYSQFAYLHPRSVVHKVPAGVAPQMAAMALPIGNGFQWIYFDGGAGPGKVVVIQGPGQQGLGGVIAAKIAGADEIIVSGLSHDAQRFELAKALGATHTIAVDREDLGAAVARITNGRMADICLDCSGLGPRNLMPSLLLLRKRGVLLTVSRGAPVDGFDVDRMINNQLTLKGLRGHSFEAVEMALRTMASNRLPLELMSTHKFGLNDVDKALKIVGGQMEERSIHVSIDPWM
ncbi:MAG: Threonine dehydrogenase [Hyphomicrobiales bacterium]|nr:Threonine dehydrogenase [Hyphomicrobiales bacterium]